MKKSSTLVDKGKKIKNVMITKKVCSVVRKLVKVDSFYNELFKSINAYGDSTSSINFIRENDIYNIMFENKSNNKSLSIQINLKNYSKNKDVFQIVCRSSDGSTTVTNRYISNSDGIYLSKNKINKNVRKDDDFSYYSTTVDNNFYEYKSDGFEFHKKLERSDESYKKNNLTDEKFMFGSNYEVKHEFWRNDDGLVFSRKIMNHFDDNNTFDGDYIYIYPYCLNSELEKELTDKVCCYGYGFDKKFFAGFDLDIESIDKIYSHADMILKSDKEQEEDVKKK